MTPRATSWSSRRPVCGRISDRWRLRGRLDEGGAKPHAGFCGEGGPMLPNAPRSFDFGLGETADMLRESVAGFAADRIAPLADRVDREDWFPRELWPEMGGLGLHGITVSEEEGGAGLGYLEHCIAMEEVSRASGSVGLSYGAPSNLCVNQIFRWGPPVQRW